MSVQLSRRGSRPCYIRVGGPSAALIPVLLLSSGCGDSPTGPAAGALRLELVAPATLAFGTSASVEVALVDAEGRRPATDFSLAVLSSDPAHGDLPVLEVAGRALTATGPGTAVVVARRGELTSAPVTVAVPRLAIVTGVRPASLPAEGGVVTFEGYDLELLGQVELEGVPWQTRREGAATVIDVPPTPFGCYGRAGVTLRAPAGHLAGNALFLPRARPDEVRLGVGEWRTLSGRTDVCVRLPAIAGARYALAYFDTRGIRAAEHGDEPTHFEGTPVEFRVHDRTASESSALGGTGSVVGRSDVRLAVTRLHGLEPEEHYTRRRTPWGVGDIVDVGFGGGSDRGVVFHVTEEFAFATLDRDAGRNVVGRLRGLPEAIAAARSVALPALTEIWDLDRPLTTPGAKQMLVVIGSWGFPGIFAGITGPADDNGGFIGIDPGVELPNDFDLWIGQHVVVHELAHAYQHRYMQARCRDESDCLLGGWFHPWAVEGGAELVTEHVTARVAGIGFASNESLGRMASVYGPLFWWGPAPHYSFGTGYGSASWLLRDFVHRQVDAGVPIAVAFGEVARGSLEGWYGNALGSGARPGLAERMRNSLGAGWDPAEAAVLAALTIGADDRTTNPQLAAPFVRNAWERFEPAMRVALGGGSVDLAVVRGISFAHYDVTDGVGEGGSVHLFTDGTELDWAIVRVR